MRQRWTKSKMTEHHRTRIEGGETQERVSEGEREKYCSHERQAAHSNYQGGGPVSNIGFTDSALHPSNTFHSTPPPAHCWRERTEWWKAGTSVRACLVLTRPPHVTVHPHTAQSHNQQHLCRKRGQGRTHTLSFSYTHTYKSTDTQCMHQHTDTHTNTQWKTYNHTNVRAHTPTDTHSHTDIHTDT